MGFFDWLLGPSESDGCEGHHFDDWEVVDDSPVIVNKVEKSHPHSMDEIEIRRQCERSCVHSGCGHTQTRKRTLRTLYKRGPHRRQAEKTPADKIDDLLFNIEP